MKQKLELLVVRNYPDAVSVYLDQHRIAGPAAFAARGPILARLLVDRSEIEHALSRVDLGEQIL